jgi:thiamine biosynthesis protein ThiI
MMLRIADGVAWKHNDLVISGGESIGQVASQTLYSMQVIEEVGQHPFIRPLATYDKMDIIDIAKDIGTYDISIRPFEDCCTIFTLKDPVTHPNLDKVHEIEDSFDWKTMVHDCIHNCQVEHISVSQEEEF